MQNHPYIRMHGHPSCTICPAEKHITNINIDFPFKLPTIQQAGPLYQHVDEYTGLLQEAGSVLLLHVYKQIYRFKGYSTGRLTFSVKAKLLMYMCINYATARGFTDNLHPKPIQL